MYETKTFKAHSFVTGFTIIRSLSPVAINCNFYMCCLFNLVSLHFIYMLWTIPTSVWKIKALLDNLTWTIKLSKYECLKIKEIYNR